MDKITLIKGISMTPVATLESITNLSSYLAALNLDNKQSVLSTENVNGKLKRTYNQTEAVAATGAHARKITALCKELDIDFTRFDKSWQIDIDDVLKLRKACSQEELFQNQSKLPIYCVSNLKGGAGKTTITVTLASGLAIEIPKGYRVGVLDLDPQGTSTAMLKPNFSDDDLSIGDLLMENFELSEGETFSDLCKEAFYETNIPNFRVMCSRPEDRQHEFYVKMRENEAEEAGESYNAYTAMEKIIDSVKDDFDILFIDTSPYFSAMTLAGHYVATSLIVPIRPSENDQDSSEKYVKFLADMYSLLMGMGHKGYDNVKVMLSGIRRSSVSQVRIAQNIRMACNKSRDFQHIYTHEFIESDAVTNCAEDYCTVYDYSASEYPASKASLKLAQNEYRLIINEIELECCELWGI
ncbi:ParA family protein (plasmid) [Psychrobium sp. nBUS_13]|uniref:ParA family protein n=1 Tax=Psychrobium sp. nBUS_13 TaxID=3395319 RepID=UPI003EBE78EA